MIKPPLHRKGREIACVDCVAELPRQADFRQTIEICGFLILVLIMPDLPPRDLQDEILAEVSNQLRNVGCVTHFIQDLPRFSFLVWCEHHQRFETFRKPGVFFLKIAITRDVSQIKALLDDKTESSNLCHVWDCGHPLHVNEERPAINNGLGSREVCCKALSCSTLGYNQLRLNCYPRSVYS